MQEELECCGAEPVVYWVDEPETRVRVCVSSARETTRRLGRCVLAWHTNVCDQPGVNRGGFYKKSDRQPNSSGAEWAGNGQASNLLAYTCWSFAVMSECVTAAIFL